MNHPEEENLYELLQVQPSADLEIIQAAYRRLILRYHPDRNNSPEALEITQRLNRAYEILSDPSRRAAYDRELASKAGGPAEGARHRRPSPPQSPPRPQRSPTADANANGVAGRGNKSLKRSVGLAVIMIAGGIAAIIYITVGSSDTQVPSNTLVATQAATTAVALAPIFSPIPTTTIVPVQRDWVRVDNVDIPVELAVNPEERIRGLSGRASLVAGTGMLFVFEVESRLRFWMREMEFPLDMVWIDAECQVVDTSVNVPPPEPGTSLEDLPRYSPGAPAMYVLEINGGEAETLGLGAGDPVEFLNGLAGKYGC